jgi:hypothetical protein
MKARTFTNSGTRCGEPRPLMICDIMSLGSGSVFCCPFLASAFVSGFFAYSVAILLVLVPGIVLAVWEKRFEVVLLATLPVVGVFVTGGAAVEQRLLLAIPFWIILMSFTFAALLKLRPWPGVQILFCAIAALILLDGLIPSIRYIYAKTKNPV